MRGIILTTDNEREGDILTSDEKLNLILSNMASVAARDDVISINAETKNELYEEIIRAEKSTDELSDIAAGMMVKIDTLLLKADNTSLLLKLINQQADELSGLKMRLDAVEKRLA